MSKEAIKLIKDAEAEASEMKKSVLAEIKDMLVLEEKNGKELCRKAEEEAAESAARVIAEAEKEAAKIIDYYRIEGLRESGTLKEFAGKKMADAIKLIKEGVVK